MATFSSHDRLTNLQQLRSQTFDLIIIGGGITGAGIALDAASRGLRTALVEKVDFAFGTSSRSTKLIHGGLRYLKQLEFGLVKEVGSERAIVHGLAPHLVVPEKMLLPLSEKRGLGYWLTSIGLKIYDWLAGVKAEDRRRMLTRVQTLRYEPLLKDEDIRGGAIYAEYRTDDARLTVEIMKQAAREGAIIANYVLVKDFVYENNVVAGVVAAPAGGDEFTIKGKFVVSAAGPWVDELREINRSKQGKRLHLTKGVHIVLPRQRLPVKQAIYFDVEDGRMIFAIPRGRITYVGTTDTNYTGDKDNVRTTREDANYLISAVNATFPSVQLKVSDIESSWAGLRPLIHEEGKSASELSRKDEIFESSTGLISIAGGKLTGYRKMAERVVNLVARKHGGNLGNSKTSGIRLGSNPFNGVKDVAKFAATLKSQAAPLSLSEHQISYLVENYGGEAKLVIEQALRSGDQGDQALILAELEYCVHNEMVYSLSDFFVRRTGLIFFDIARVQRWKELIATRCGTLLGWSSERTAQELGGVEEWIRNATTFS
ncbi:glycerol-3-phosphate dehydrogenase/oxidase [Chryseolinea sp. T2]|uniref:glycerol-3-phosphate dehydrogenase/oxidase n=1 Tax=Chryseolinea sp. T2 TaxID=3129255 RepID=UPI003077385C